MAEPKPLPACANCDHACEDNPYNEDGECWKTMTAAERLAVGIAVVAETQQADIVWVGGYPRIKGVNDPK